MNRETGSERLERTREASAPALRVATILRIAGYLVAYRNTLMLALLCMAAASAFWLAPLLCIKLIIDDAIPSGDRAKLLLLCGGMVAGPLVAALLDMLQRYLAAHVAEHVVFDLRLALFRHIQKQPLSYFVNSTPGEVLSHVLNDVQGVGQMLRANLMRALRNVAVIATSAVALLWLDWRLAAIALLLLPAFMLPIRTAGEKRKLLKQNVQSSLARLTGLLVETLSTPGALLIKLAGSEGQETVRLEQRARELREASLRYSLVGRWFKMIMKVLAALGPALVYGLGGWLVISGDIALGTVVAFAGLLGRLYSPVSDLAGVHVEVITSYAYFESIFRVLDTEPAIRNAPNPIVVRDLAGSIRFERVSLAYAREEPVLRDIDLEVPAGKCVAIIGPSGAGKTTLAMLVPRLYDPTRGIVRVDGHDVRALELHSLRSNIAVVTQDTYLFHASIMDNLRYGRPGASPAEIESAARAAQIHALIVNLPHGYKTLVGDRGCQLSGGERQRLAIARALLKNPRILILDEAMNSLDDANERLVQAALEPLLRGRTSLVIAHRLSTIRNADQVVVLKGGRIEEVPSAGTDATEAAPKAGSAASARPAGVRAPLFER